MGGRGSGSVLSRADNEIARRNEIIRNLEAGAAITGTSEGAARQLTQLRVDNFNQQLLTTGRFADQLNRNGIVSIPMDYYAGTNNDFIRMARSMGYEASYDRQDDAVEVRRRGR